MTETISAGTSSGVPTPPTGLRRNLSGAQVIALSIGTMAPSMAININPQGAAGLAGRAVPLTLVLATIAVLLVSYGFARLSQHFNHAGSVFGLVGATIGPRAGAIAGWMMVGAYLLFGVSAAVAGGRFVAALVLGAGADDGTASVVAYVVGGVILLVGVALSIFPAKRATDLILVFEGVTVLLIVIISVVVVVRLVGHTAPAGQTFDLSVFAPAKGTDPSSLALAAVFGFLSFAGFESSASLGEEAGEPRKDIPRALVGTAIGGGVFFVVVSAIEVMGFGTDGKALKAFAGSGSLFGDLGTQYLATWVGDIVTIGSAISAIGGAIACVVATSRILYALARDASPRPTALGSTSARWGTPVTAVLVTGALMIVTEIVSAIGATDALEAYGFVGTTGVYLILVGYLMVTVGAIKLLFTGARTTPAVPRWQIVVPVLAILALLYILYRNIWPYPTGAYAWLPVVAVAWALVAIVVAVARPGVAKRIGERLTADEALEDTIAAAS
jgi:amino acid transporter